MRSGFFVRSESVHTRPWQRWILSMVVLGVAALWLAFTVHWALDMIGTSSRGVITRNLMRDYLHPQGYIEAHTDDGVNLDVTGYDSEATPGVPVIVTRSVVTGDVTAVSSPLGSASLLGHVSLFFVEVLFPLALAAALGIGWKWVLWVTSGLPKTPIVGVPVLAFGVTLALLLTLAPSPVLPAGGTPSWPQSDVVDPGRTVAADKPAVIGNVSVAVDGPISHQLPAGASDWLNDYNVVIIPLRAEVVGPQGDMTFVRFGLIGDGGVAVSIGPRVCAGNPEFGEAMSLFPATSGRGLACFVVPAKFRPRQLVMTEDSIGHDEVAIDVSGRT